MLHLLSYTLVAVASLIPTTLVTVGTLFIAIVGLAVGLAQPHHPKIKLEYLSQCLDDLEQTMLHYEANSPLPDRTFVVTSELTMHR